MRGVRLFPILLLVAILAPPSSAAAARTPLGFVGMNGDGPLFDSHVNLPRQLSRMVASGVQAVRVSFAWSEAQPYQTWDDVPQSRQPDFVHARGAGGVPTDFQRSDRIVAQAAALRMPLLPVIVYAPQWDGSQRGNGAQPKHAAPFGHFMTALVDRYGPHGTFWAQNPSLSPQPIRRWQVWNEPDTAFYWNTRKFAPSYVSLLRVAHHAIKRADPGAKVVLASLTNFGWRDLASIYKVRGARKLFDVAASNPYTRRPDGVITILGYFRRVMRRHGDASKPLIATEVGWPSALGKTSQNYGFNTTEKGQARKLGQLMPLLASNRRRLGLSAFYYYTWISNDRPGAPSSFQFSGLLHFDSAARRVSAKPAYRVFRRVALKLEGCRQEPATPTSCVRR